MRFLIPTSLKGKLFVLLTFINVGISSFFAGSALIQQTIFSGVTAIICLGMWIRELNLDEFRE